MKALSLSEIVDRLHGDDGALDLFASAEARYDAAEHSLSVELDAFARPEDVTENERRSRPVWLPPAQTVRCHCSSDDASDMARDVFHTWARRVHAAAVEAGSAKPAGL